MPAHGRYANSAANGHQKYRKGLKGLKIIYFSPSFHANVQESTLQRLCRIMIPPSITARRRSDDDTHLPPADSTPPSIRNHFSFPHRQPPELNELNRTEMNSDLIHNPIAFRIPTSPHRQHNIPFYLSFLEQDSRNRKPNEEEGEKN